PDAREAYLRQVGELGGQLGHWVATGRWGGGRPGALNALDAHVTAEIARAAGDDDGPRWLAVAELWASHGMRPREAYARFRAAEAFVRAMICPAYGPAEAEEAVMIASVHLVDLSVRRALAVMRRASDPASTPGLRYSKVALAAPLRSSLLPSPDIRRPALLAFWDDD